MELDSVIKKRRSVRSFSDKKVSWKLLLDAIDAAVHAPFAGNYNNLKFVIIENPERLNMLARHASQDWIMDASSALIVCSDDTNLEKLYGERGRIYSRQQAGAAIQTLLLKLADLGLAACWVGAYTDSKIRNDFSIPKEIQIEAVIPIGYEKKTFKSKTIKKKKLEAVLFWEAWDKNRRETLFKEPSIHTPDSH
ncbi:nitroreductase family protein [Candidatus Pacearchaeota archaeon]|nr:nitroreductase family protein [Candidatus Pacearchaeota archaeon]